MLFALPHHRSPSVAIIEVGAAACFDESFGSGVKVGEGCGFTPTTPLVTHSPMSDAERLSRPTPLLL